MSDNSLFPAPINVVSINPDDDLQRIYEVFRLTGMMIAKSISDDRLIELPLSPVFWDLILGKKMNIFDLERLDPNLFKVFADLQVLANRKRDIDKAVFFDQDHKQRQLNTLKTQSGARLEDLTLAFTLPGYDSIELKPNGKDEDVTLDNLQEYIDLVLHFLFHETVKIQIQAFKKGFNHIFPVDNLRPFAGNLELEDMICGTQRNEDEWANPAKLAEFITPAHGFHQTSPQFLYFVRFMSELAMEDRRKFLRFITGSPRLPNGGFGSLDPKITVVLKKPIIPAGASSLMSQEMMQAQHIDEILPSVMACQNYIKLPAYSSFEMLRDKFMKAINEGANNFTLS
ncbi:hypothetical protein FGO68_gene6592 [Halteria grandinella]|uniref:HECT domain-containing protein n=1 Tax=Halteria grandinella TaxID=5974 RepID=A0A8J8SW42_HALGN|nr:hypothetical protein FGO68_gene12 [Halteria grandinella]TNV72472.1 hypothetical protein FGO68_gene6592 [Halteria grandinella]